MRQTYYPAWICGDCGAKHGRKECGIATFHEDTCGVCLRTVIVTEPRDYGHLNDSWLADYQAAKGET